MTIEEIKKRIAELKSAIPEQIKKVETLDAFQKAVKVVANGGYGAIGNVGFRYFRPAISEAITVTGQYIIRHTADRLNWFLNKTLKTEGVDYVIGSDTDSIMLTLDGFVKLIDPKGTADKQKLVDAVNSFCENKIEKFLEQEFEALAKRLNARVQKILKVVQISVFALWLIQLLATRTNLFCEIDPFKVAFNLFSANWIGYALLGILLISSVLIYKPFCRTICPVGLTLGLVS